MAKKSERMLKMMENFISLRDEGLSIGEIAEKFNLSPTAVYRSLNEIAEKNGCSRKDLLDRPIEADHSGRNFTPVKPINREMFNRSFEAMISGLDSMEREITHVIADLEGENYEESHCKKSISLH